APGNRETPCGDSRSRSPESDWASDQMTKGELLWKQFLFLLRFSLVGSCRFKPAPTRSSASPRHPARGDHPTAPGGRGSAIADHHSCRLAWRLGRSLRRTLVACYWRVGRRSLRRFGNSSFSKTGRRCHCRSVHRRADARLRFARHLRHPWCCSAVV